MGILQDELQEIKKLCEHKITGSKLVSCVETMVRVEIKKTNFKHIIICIQFPRNYPNVPLLLELKSKTFSDKLLSKLTDICELEIKKLTNKPQILKLLLFIENFINENPLCCCYNEINNLKPLLSNVDELKLRQKTSSISIKLSQNIYYLKVKISVPENYPDQCISISELETNFPTIFQRFILAQSKEIARQCIEPPLRKPKGKINELFKPKPSLEKVVLFLIDCIKRLPTEICQICNEQCFPDNPNNAVTDEGHSKHVERLYCGHILHKGCLVSYMSKPPFGNKKCANCKKNIYHEKWGINDKLAEDRWAHGQARERELAEVTDFFNS